MERNQLPRLLPSLLWEGVLIAATLAMATSPLFGILGFEASFVWAGLVSLAAAHLAARAMAHRRAASPDSDRALADAFPGRRIASWFVGDFLRATTLLIVPLLLLAANGLRVKNCNPAAGLAWFLLLPIVSVATGSAAGLVAGLTCRRAPASLAIGIVLGSAAWGLARFYLTPPVFAYDPFLGFFPGTLYDEELPIERMTVLARALDLGFVVVVLAATAALIDGRELRLQPRVASTGWALAALLLGVGWLGAYARLHDDIAPSRSSIARHLGGRLETAHFTLLFSPAGPWAKEIDRVAADAEFRYAQLARTFGAEPHRRVIAFLFDSPAEKRRYLGASHTQVAKPWRGELYLQHAAWPHPVLKHELAHVFAGAFGDRWFAVSRRGLLFQWGLIEGAAVAAGEGAERLSLDQRVKVMRRLGVEPPLGEVLGVSFMAYPAARAYSLAGSFCRYLLATHGAEGFRVLYRSGGDFQRAYGMSLAHLAAAWSRQVDAAPLSDAEYRLAKERFERPSVFHRLCAHEIATRRARAHAAGGTAELALLESICREEPDEPQHRVELMEAFSEAGQAERAVDQATALLGHPKTSESARGQALVVIGDQALRAGRLADARRAFTTALRLALDEPVARPLRVRLLACEDGGVAAALRRYLVGDGEPHDRALDLLRAAQVVEASPEQGLGHYLLGRQLATQARPTEARSELARARLFGLPDRGVSDEAKRLEARAAFELDDRAAARRLWSELSESPDPALVAEARDWVARCDFVEPTRP